MLSAKITNRPDAPHNAARRWFLRDCGLGLGTIALGHLLASNSLAASPAVRLSDPLAPKPPHFPAKAKRIIYLFMAGGPSQLELFDDKPALVKHANSPPPAELLKNYRTAFIDPSAKLLAPKFKFSKYGQ